MKTIKSLILLVACFSFTASGAYAQGNGQGRLQDNGEQLQKQFRKGQGNGGQCDPDKCVDPNCENGKCGLGQGKGKGKAKKKGAGQGKGKGAGQGRGKGGKGRRN